MKRELRVGDRLQTCMPPSWGLATITKIEQITTNNREGLLVSQRYEDIDYDTQPVLMDGGAVTGSRIEDRRMNSGMPAEFINCTAKDVNWSLYGSEDVSTQKKTINAYVLKFEERRREGMGLYISSSVTGSGKTMIACAVANEILRKCDLPVKFISAADYFEAIKLKDSYGKDLVQSIFEAGLLVLDDIGAQAESKDWITAAMFRLVDGRHAGLRPTIFTSNLLVEDLRTDPRIIDRIRARSIPIFMPEVNIRRRLADARTREILQNFTK